MLIINRDLAGINTTTQILISTFEMSDLTLGIKIHRTPQHFSLSKFHYIENLLEKFKYFDLNIIKTEIDVFFALKNTNESNTQFDYVRVLG